MVRNFCFRFFFFKHSHTLDTHQHLTGFPATHAGRKEGLAWLAECLSEALEDREDGECDEAIPLVPLTDCAIASMEDHTFLKFIAKVGLAPPANEQVCFFFVCFEMTSGTFGKSFLTILFLLNCRNNSGAFRLR